MATSQELLQWGKQFCRGTVQEQERDEDIRRDGKTTSQNGQEWGIEIP